jgi:hypothetical protein
MGSAAAGDRWRGAGLRHRRADIVRPEHIVEFFRLLGGGVIGDLAGLPRHQLAILPGTTHVTVADQVDLLVPMIKAFLDAPMPEAK